MPRVPLGYLFTSLLVLCLMQTIKWNVIVVQESDGRSETAESQACATSGDGDAQCKSVRKQTARQWHYKCTGKIPEITLSEECHRVFYTKLSEPRLQRLFPSNLAPKHRIYDFMNLGFSRCAAQAKDNEYRMEGECKKKNSMLRKDS